MCVPPPEASTYCASCEKSNASARSPYCPVHGAAPCDMCTDLLRFEPCCPLLGTCPCPQPFNPTKPAPLSRLLPWGEADTPNPDLLIHPGDTPDHLPYNYQPHTPGTAYIRPADTTTGSPCCATELPLTHHALTATARRTGTPVTCACNRTWTVYPITTRPPRATRASIHAAQWTAPPLPDAATRRQHQHAAHWRHEVRQRLESIPGAHSLWTPTTPGPDGTTVEVTSWKREPTLRLRFTPNHPHQAEITGTPAQLWEILKAAFTTTTPTVARR